MCSLWCVHFSVFTQCVHSVCLLQCVHFNVFTSVCSLLCDKIGVLTSVCSLQCPHFNTENNRFSERNHSSIILDKIKLLRVPLGFVNRTLPMEAQMKCRLKSTVLHPDMWDSFVGLWIISLILFCPAEFLLFLRHESWHKNKLKNSWSWNISSYIKPKNHQIKPSVVNT